MSMADDNERIQDEDGLDGPVFVLPGAGATTTQSLGGGSGMMTGSPIIPERVLTASEIDSSNSGSLTERLEQTLAEDGRFAPLLPALIVSADDAGRVTLSGILRDAILRPSLLATLHAIPGVTEVTDTTR